MASLEESIKALLEPIKMGYDSTLSELRGDLEGKGILGTAWSGLNQMASGAPHVFMPRVPVYKSAVQELSPDAITLMQRMGLDPDAVKQVGSKAMGQIFSEQVGGSLATSIADLLKAGKFGRLPQ